MEVEESGHDFKFPIEKLPCVFVFFAYSLVGRD